MKVQEKKKKDVVLFSRLRQNVKFEVVTVQRRVTNKRKSVKQVQYCCYANLNLICFFAVLVAFSSSLLKLPNIPEETSTLTKMHRSKCQFLPLPRFPSLLE